METILMFYFTLIITSGNPGLSHTIQAYGPYHTEYSCEQVLGAKLTEIKEDSGRGYTVVLATTCAQPVVLLGVSK